MESNTTLKRFDPDHVPSEENFKQLPDGKTFFELRGPKDGPLIVLLHGITWYSFKYQTLSEHLVSNGYQVLSFDFFGRGYSDAPSHTPYKPKFLVKQFEDLLDSLDFKDNKFILLGYSMGGLIASLYTSAHPERVTKLILLAPAIVPVQIPFIAKLMITPVIGYSLFSMFGKGAMLKRMQDERFSQDFAYPDKYPEIIDDLILRCSWMISKKQGFMPMFHSTLQHFPNEGCLDAVETIAKANVPIYVLWGELDKTVPYAHHSLVLEKAPNAKIVKIEDVGHAVLFEASNDICKYVLEFAQE